MTLHIGQTPAPVEASVEALSETVEDVRVTFNNMQEDLLQISAALGRINKSIDAIIRGVGDAIGDLDNHLYG
jgi:ABC-type transporter Mla subunit MlaD